MRSGRPTHSGRILAILLCLATLAGGVLIGAPPAQAGGTEGGDHSYFGFEAGLNDTGVNNSFFGVRAGRDNTGDENAFFGEDAGSANEAPNNAFFGFGAGRDNTTANRNAFFGSHAGARNTTGCCNAFFGASAGFRNLDGNRNAFFGDNAGQRNTEGSDNAFFGQLAGFRNATGTDNSFLGQDAGRENKGGNRNTFVGSDAGRENTEGNDNAFFGKDAGRFNTTGTGNAFFGRLAGASNTDEDDNTFLGSHADLGTPGITNATAVGHRAQVDQSDTVVLGSIDGVNGATATTRVGIGTTRPGRPLTVDATNDSAGKEQVLQLLNNGAPGFELNNTDAGEAWRYAMDVNDRFVVSRAGSGGAEFLIGKQGQVFMGRPFDFFKRANGNLEIDGTLTENSDRAAKSDVSAVDAQGTLETLRELPISTWEYTDDPGATHIGPMAQEFHELFGFGSDPTKISPRDMASVAMATIQALDEQVQSLQAGAEAKDEVISDQQRQIDDLEERLERLEAASAR